MSTAMLTIFGGVVLAIPFIFILELESAGAITLLIFLSCGIVGILSGLVKHILKNKRKKT